MKRLLMVLAVLLAPVLPIQPTHAGPVDHTPVILVHGYNDRPGGCQGITLPWYWNNVSKELAYIGKAASDLIPVAYYACDTGGVDITGSGPGTNFPTTVAPSGQQPRAGYTNNAPIAQIAHDLAWFIYNQYAGPVHVVGHSMGGLIIREALRRVEAGDPSFPPSLNVTKVITFSTPHAGWEVTCTKNAECRDMTKGSKFLTDLATNPAPQGSQGTSWWAVGASGCDFIRPESATAVAGQRVVYRFPCYKHNEYLTDLRQARGASGTTNTGGRYSLALMGAILGGAA